MATNASCTPIGYFIDFISFKTPSNLNLTRTFVSWGSIWTSETPRDKAFLNIWLTNFQTGYSVFILLSSFFQEEDFKDSCAWNINKLLSSCVCSTFGSHKSSRENIADKKFFASTFPERISPCNFSAFSEVIIFFSRRVLINGWKYFSVIQLF